MFHKRLKQSLYCGSVLTAFVLAAITVAKAGDARQQLTTIPFITAESAQTKDFHAVAFHKGRRNPYLFSTNTSIPSEGSYSGVLLNCNGQPGFGAFDTLSFAYSGPKDARTFVIFKPRIGPFLTRSLTLDQGLPGGTSRDGFSDVSFSKGQFGITPGSFIRDIVIVPPPSKTAGRFLIDDIRVDKEPVKKVLATKFLASEKGPVGGALNFVAESSAAVSSPTAVVVRNNTKSSVEVWVTLGAGTSYTQVNQVFPQSGANDPPWANGGTGMEDHLTLPAPSGKTLSLIRSVGNLTTVNGRTFFGTAGSSIDPTAGGGCPTTTYPCGASLAEWSLNPADVITQGEACNISLNNGMNAKIAMVYKFDNGFDWNDGPTSPGGKLNIVNVARTKTPLSANGNNDGVYPFNCPCCTTPVCGNANCGYIFPVSTCTQSSLGACWGTSPIPAQPATNPSSRALCQVQRNNGTGGEVNIVFNGFINLTTDCK